MLAPQVTVSQNSQTKAKCKLTCRINIQQHLLKYFPATIIRKENCHVLPQSPVQVDPDTRWPGPSKRTKCPPPTCGHILHCCSTEQHNININFTRPNLVILFCKSPWHRSGAALIRARLAVAIHELPTLPNAHSNQTRLHTPRATPGLWPMAKPVQGQLVPKSSPVWSAATITAARWEPPSTAVN